jgi:NADPH:quinone reductase-like Zn-dependent oxidoreductase
MKKVCAREFGLCDNAKVEDIEDPAPGPDDVVINVKVTKHDDGPMRKGDRRCV